MDQSLRCNNQVNSNICRAVLRQQAVVTTCAHVFCLPCAESAGLSSSPREQRQCPTCKSNLPNSYDVVINLLNPPEDYKASVLAGLGPATIVECAQRALSFWTYQSAQEHGYQQYVARRLSQRCQQLKFEADKIVRDANTRIESLERRIHELTADRRSMEDKYADLFSEYQERYKKYQETQKLYDAIKEKVQVEKVGAAANNHVDPALRSIDAIAQPATIHRNVDLRQDCHQTQSHDMAERTVPGNRLVQAPPERLHPHQRSASSAAGSHSDHMRMPPPGGPRISRITDLVTSATPMQRIALPAGARLNANRSRIPVTAVRSHPQAGQKLPGSSRRQQIQSSKMPGSAQNYRAVSAGMKVGRAGTAGSLEISQSYGHFADRIIQSARRSADQAATGGSCSAGYM